MSTCNFEAQTQKRSHARIERGDFAQVIGQSFENPHHSPDYPECLSSDALFSASNVLYW